METNQNPVQEQSAQPISNSPKPLYNPDEAARIAGILADLYKPEYILLFGALVGGVPHSEAVAYDLLVVTRDVSGDNWQEAKRLVQLKFPAKYREIPYVNIYIVTLKYIASGSAPFLWFARKEGAALYERDPGCFHRPRTPLAYPFVASRAVKYFDTFLSLGSESLRLAEAALAARKIRLAAIIAGQSAQFFYRTLYFVYHGVETPVRDLIVLHDRVRTLSVELMLLFDDDRFVNKHSLSDLRSYLAKAYYDADFEIDLRELAACIDSVHRMFGIVERAGRRRIERYLTPANR